MSILPRSGIEMTIIIPTNTRNDGLKSGKITLSFQTLQRKFGEVEIISSITELSSTGL